MANATIGFGTRRCQRNGAHQRPEIYRIIYRFPRRSIRGNRNRRTPGDFGYHGLERLLWIGQLVGQILGKLGVATRTEAVVVAARRGLLWL